MAVAIAEISWTFVIFIVYSDTFSKTVTQLWNNPN